MATEPALEEQPCEEEKDEQAQVLAPRSKEEVIEKSLINSSALQVNNGL